MKKIFLSVGIILATVLLIGVSIIAEEITLTTYYPAPYGEYQNLYVSGNVGIGTTSPVALLDVYGTSNKIRMSYNASNYVDLSVDSAGRLGIMNGNVGIGTTNPTATLHVNGNIKAKMQTDFTGNTTVWEGTTAGTVYELGYDVAELFEANEEVEPGDVLSIDEKGNLRRSSEAYDLKVAGIVSEAPAILFEGNQLQIAPQPFTFQGGKKPPLALAGRVLCKVTTRTGGPIKRGDLLVTSSKAGYAMRSRPENVRIGTVLGKALEPLDSGDGKIMVLVTLQ